MYITANIEYQALLNMILGIVEIEKRGSIISMGYSSTFSFLRDKLKYSEGSANRRIYAARCIAKFPFVFSLLKTSMEKHTSQGYDHREYRKAA